MPRIFFRHAPYKKKRSFLCSKHCKSLCSSMASARLLRFSPSLPLPSSSARTVRCLDTVDSTRGRPVVRGDDERRKQVCSMKAATAASEYTVTLDEQLRPRILDLSSIMSYVRLAILIPFWTSIRPKPWRLHVQMFIDKIVIDCRFFTLLAVAGSLLGSILCFLEGCFIVLESYLQYFTSLSQRLDQGQMMQLLIEAIDMFLVGTAMLIFGMGLYTMFVGRKTVTEQGHCLSGSNLFGLFYAKTLPTWIDMQSIDEAKSKMGHAVMMILQVGVIDKFKSIPLVTGLDLACFAGAVLLSSASIFVLSRLSLKTAAVGDK